MTTIKLKNGSGAPATSDLVQGEPALDLTNKRLYTENASGAIIEIGTSPSTIDINAGTIDGTVIGGASAAAGTFTTITGTTITATGTVTINNDGGSSFSHSRLILDSNGASRAAGIFSHNQVNDTEWFFGNPYDTPDSFAINRQATASHNDSTSNKTNSLVTVNSSGNVGIGTTSPTSELTLGTNSTIEMLGGSSVLKFTREDTTTISGNPLGAIEFAHTDTDDAGVASKIIGEGDGSSGQGRISFHTGTPSALTERMRIDSNGQIMIAGSTTAFDTTAAVNGLQAYYETDTGLATLGSYSSGGSTSMTFHTNSGGGASAERMRIDSSGALFVGATSASSSAVGVKIQPNGYGGLSAAVNIVGSSSGSSNSGFSQYSTGAGAYRFYVDYAGTIFATSTSISAISDASLKENVRDLDKGLDTINALQPRRFDWKNGDGNDIMGFIAQEVEGVMPELVHEYKYSDEENKKGLKMGDMVPSMVKAIQELSAQVNELKAEVAALKGE